MINSIIAFLLQESSISAADENLFPTIVQCIPSSTLISTPSKFKSELNIHACPAQKISSLTKIFVVENEGE